MSYRLPREPSTPRITLWRRLRRLGVAQISDGMVALPADARTREQLEWAADHVVEHGGDAHLWLARPATADEGRALAARMATERAAEYREVTAAATAALSTSPAQRRRSLATLRRTQREITRRDFFPPPDRDAAALALRELAAAVDGEHAPGTAPDPAAPVVAS